MVSTITIGNNDNDNNNNQEVRSKLRAGSLL